MWVCPVGLGRGLRSRGCGLRCVVTCESSIRLLCPNGGELTLRLTELRRASVSDLDSGLGWSWTPLAFGTKQKHLNQKNPIWISPGVSDGDETLKKTNVWCVCV